VHIRTRPASRVEGAPECRGKMGYLFLTGATGLVGSYLLHDFLRAGLRVAALVRPTRLESPSRRIESVMARWEKQAGHALPRPVIVEGDLSNDRLGLDDRALCWVSGNCTAFVHNAANLRYVSDRRSGEPWRTNVDGVRHVLEFCRRTGIRQYHHVSTAYVCGLRKGRILESDVDVGQELSNEYERTKLQGEKLVRAAAYIDPPTIYRPAIIIGDSRTGHTTTFHGFYAPLKLGHAMFKRIVLDQVDVDPLQQALNLRGDEQKNLVPVEWVSAVITRVVTYPEHHGRTYHLVPSRRVAVEVMREAMIQAFLLYADLTEKGEGWYFEWPEFVQYFRQRMAIYEAYWRDDPEFDWTNTEAAAPDLPCPEVGADMLLRACKFAIESNFGWPRPSPPKIAFDVNRHLQGLPDAAAAEKSATCVGLQVNGPGGGQWKLLVDNGHAIAAEPGLPARSAVTFYLHSKTFENLVTRQATAEQLLRTARILIEGNGMPLPYLIEVLQSVAADSRRNPCGN
jgi:thioester reductase-like protein